jgi:hypothetical protein
MRYVIHILIAIDQLGTAVVGGYPDETLSSYAYRLYILRKPGGRIWKPTIDFLFSWQRLPLGHCHASWMAERERREMPPELR